MEWKQTDGLGSKTHCRERCSSKEALFELILQDFCSNCFYRIFVRIVSTGFFVRIVSTGFLLELFLQVFCSNCFYRIFVRIDLQDFCSNCFYRSLLVSSFEKLPSGGGDVMITVFLRFATIFGEKIGVFHNNQCYVGSNILHNLALFWVKKCQIFTNFLAKIFFKS
jgi:hypothetical protein